MVPAEEPEKDRFADEAVACTLVAGLKIVADASCHSQLQEGGNSNWTSFVLVKMAELMVAGLT